jgi:predicted  nucleic acid-binding Zn-ribbon protein
LFNNSGIVLKHISHHTKMNPPIVVQQDIPTIEESIRVIEGTIQAKEVEIARLNDLILQHPNDFSTLTRTQQITALRQEITALRQQIATLQQRINILMNRRGAEFVCFDWCHD